MFSKKRYVLSIRLLRENLGGLKRAFLFFVLAGIADGCLTFALPLFISHAVSRQSQQYSLAFLVNVTGGLFAASLLLQWTIRRWGESLGPRFGLQLRERYFRTLEAMPPQRLSDFHSGYLISLTGTVSDGVGSLITEIIWGITRTGVHLLLFFIFTAQVAMGIALVDAALLGLFLWTNAILAGQAVVLSQELGLRRAALGGRYADMMSNLPMVKKLGLRRFAVDLLRKAGAETTEAVMRLQRFHAKRWFLLHFLFGAVLVGTMSFLSFNALRGQLEPGAIVLFLSALVMLRTHIERVSECHRNLIDLNGHAQKLGEICYPDARDELHAGTSPFSSLALRGVTFNYPGRREEISIPEFSLSAREWVSVSGASGQGKTTLLTLLAGLAEPVNGRREWNCAAISGSLNDRVAFVAQGEELFNLPLRENLTCGAPVPDSLLDELLEELDLGEWRQKLQQGLDTVAGERGVKISAGQRQRLNLIRAFLLERDVYLIDEPTAHLDILTEQHVAAFLKRHFAAKAMVLVSHRPAITQLASRHYEFRNHVLHARNSGAEECDKNVAPTALGNL